jgi:hypothetical protein
MCRAGSIPAPDTIRKSPQKSSLRAFFNEKGQGTAVFYEACGPKQFIIAGIIRNSLFSLVMKADRVFSIPSPPASPDRLAMAARSPLPWCWSSKLKLQSSCK